jgi:hypothetical protein
MTKRIFGTQVASGLNIALLFLSLAEGVGAQPQDHTAKFTASDAVSLVTAGRAISAQKTKLSDISEVVEAVMDDAYGKTYDAKNACWVFTFTDDQGESTDYCMRPGKPDVVDAKEGKILYLNSFSATDIRGDARYGYSQVQPGLMGAFKIHLGGNQGWTYDALDNAIEYGAGGDCGCAHAQFVKLSNAGDYGWIFASGGTWQGVTVANYSIVTVIKGQIIDVSQIPQVREKAQDVRYEVSVKVIPSATGMLPLHVIQTKAGVKVDEFDIAFDAVKSVYALPAGR